MDWLESERGVGLLWEERQQVKQALESVFGEYLLQVGRWGPADAFLEASRTRHSYLLDVAAGQGADIVTASSHWGIASDSVDAVLLPHSLETAADPHQLLREVDRVLRPDGRLIVLGFNAPAVWSVRQKLSDGGFLPGLNRMVSEHRLRDWLQVLGFRAERGRFYHPAKAIDRVIAGSAEGIEDMVKLAEHSWWQRLLLRRPAEQRGLLRRLRAWRYWRATSACYITVARKEVISLTPIRESRFARPRLVGSLVNPTARTSARVIPIDRG